MTPPGSQPQRWAPDELEGSLDHTVPNRRNSQNPDLAVSLGNFLPSIPHGPVRAGDQFTAICSRNACTPFPSMASKVTPSIPGVPLFFLASRRPPEAFPSCRREHIVPRISMPYQPSPSGRSSLLRSCRSDGRLYHLVPASHCCSEDC